MKKFTRKEVKELIKNVEPNFSSLVDALIYFESTDKDDWAWDIIHTVEELGSSKEIDLLISDLIDRDFQNQDNLLYNSLWYAQANIEEGREVLINEVSKSPSVKEIVNYLTPLNKGRNREANNNIQLIIDRISLNIKSPKP